MQKIQLKVKKLLPEAKLPAYGSEFAAGADLYALSENPIRIAPQETAIVHTGLAAEIPEGYVGLIFARSGLATKKGLAPANKVGVIDSDYRGEIRIGVYNFTNEPCIVENGERLAQLVTVPLAGLAAAEAASLGDTARGAGGFGSTGSMAVKEEER